MRTSIDISIFLCALTRGCVRVFNKSVQSRNDENHFFSKYFPTLHSQEKSLTRISVNHIWNIIYYTANISDQIHLISEFNEPLFYVYAHTFVCAGTCALYNTPFFFLHLDETYQDLVFYNYFHPAPHIFFSS